MVLFPNYQSAETVYEETGELLDFIENSGKKRPHDHRNKYNEEFSKTLPTHFFNDTAILLRRKFRKTDF